MMTKDISNVILPKIRLNIFTSEDMTKLDSTETRLNMMINVNFLVQNSQSVRLTRLLLSKENQVIISHVQVYHQIILLSSMSSLLYIFLFSKSFGQVFFQSAVMNKQFVLTCFLPQWASNQSHLISYCEYLCMRMAECILYMQMYIIPEKI
jgi:hypothetical protein